MENLQKQLEELQEKQTWVRKALEKWIENFGNSTLYVEGTYFYVSELTDFRSIGCSYYLIPGRAEIYEAGEDINYASSDALVVVNISDIPIEDIRLFIQKLPERLKVVSEQIETDIQIYSRLTELLQV